MANRHVTVEDFIEHLEGLVDVYRRTMDEQRRLGRKSHGNARLYREVCRGKAEIYEECAIDIERIVGWFRGKRMGVAMGPRIHENQMQLF